MTKIIGHRGAAGLALENSRASFQIAKQYVLDAIELDVQLTADDKLVVAHDSRTARVATSNAKITRHTLDELKTLKLRNDEHFLSLDEALEELESETVIIELKVTGCIDELLLVLGRHPKAKVIISSFYPEELRIVHKLLPEIPIYVGEHFAPISVIHVARDIHADGIILNKWLLNFITYRLTRHYNLEILIYTVNSSLMARFFKKLYPDISMYTDRPDRFAESKQKT